MKDFAAGAEEALHAGRLSDFAYVADCTNTGGWLSTDALHEDALIAAPGIPFSLDAKATRKFDGRYVHDMLEIGTAVVLGLAI